MCYDLIVGLIIKVNIMRTHILWVVQHQHQHRWVIQNTNGVCGWTLWHSVSNSIFTTGPFEWRQPVIWSTGKGNVRRGERIIENACVPCTRSPFIIYVWLQAGFGRQKNNEIWLMKKYVFSPQTRTTATAVLAKYYTVGRFNRIEMFAWTFLIWLFLNCVFSLF